MNWQNYIESKPEVLFGKPAIANTRIAVDLILTKLSQGDTIEDLLQAYAPLTKEHILACLSYASEQIKNEIVLPKAS